MSSEHRRAFFGDIQEHSQIKLRALERYLPPWTTKVGSRPGTRRVWVVDGFAGAGRYDSGEPGSPAIALQHARQTHAARTDLKVACFFTELNSSNATRLKQLVAEYRDVEAFAERASFWTQLDKIEELVGTDPALVFVDPFGLGDLKFEGLVRLCNRLPRIDVIVNFASPVARRLAPGHSLLIDAAVGGPGWSLDTLTETFADRLAKKSRFRKPAVLPVANTLGELRYNMVMAARHPAAYELWNDEIARDDARVLKDDGDAAGSLVNDCLERVERYLNGRSHFQRDKLIQDLSVAECGEFHRSVYIRAVKSILESEGWRRRSGPIATALIERVP